MSEGTHCTSVTDSLSLLVLQAQLRRREAGATELARTAQQPQVRLQTQNSAAVACGVRRIGVETFHYVLKALTHSMRAKHRI